jgi:hypothetical protein
MDVFTRKWSNPERALFLTQCIAASLNAVLIVEQCHSSGYTSRETT